MKKHWFAVSIWAALLPSPALACAVCGCTLTSDWLTQGFATQPGTTVALRYDLADQSRLYSGSHRIPPSAITLPSDEEVEVDTLSHVVTATIDHQFASDFGVNVQLPYVWRRHDHVEIGDTTSTRFHVDGVGDLRIVGRWTGLSTKGGLTGLEAGVVLPTGKTHGAAERSLMPGTGTTQLVAGAFRAGRLSPTLDYVAQVTGQMSVAGEKDFRPGSYAQASFSLAYTGWRGVTPQLQLNGRIVGREGGVDGDRENSGGEQLLIAPGGTVSLGHNISAFGFIELPLATRVNGAQVVAPVKASFGLQMKI